MHSADLCLVHVVQPAKQQQWDLVAEAAGPLEVWQQVDEHEPQAAHVEDEAAGSDHHQLEVLQREKMPG